MFKIIIIVSITVTCIGYDILRAANSQRLSFRHMFYKATSKKPFSEFGVEIFSCCKATKAERSWA